MHDLSVASAHLDDRHIRRVSRHRLDNRPAVGADDDDTAQPGRVSRDEGRDVGALEQPAGDPDDRVVGAEAGVGRMRVGGLGVVDVGNLVGDGDDLVAMPSGAVRPQALHNRLARHRDGEAPLRCQAGCRKRVGDVVCTGHLEVAHGNQATASADVVDDVRPVDTDLTAFGRPQRERLAVPVRLGQPPRPLVVGVVEDGGLLALLPPDLRLVSGVVRHRAVPVDVVLRNVEDGGGIEPDRRRPVQLEARHLHREDVVRRRGLHRGHERKAHVSGGNGAVAGRPQDGLEHADSRRLAVGAGDTQPCRPVLRPGRPLDAPGELGLADHLDACGDGRSEERLRRPPTW